MFERPHQGSKIENSVESRERATEYLDADSALMSEVMNAPDAASVREAILKAFGKPDNEPASLSEDQSAILSEAVHRWNRKRSETSEL